MIPLMGIPKTADIEFDFSPLTIRYVIKIRGQKIPEGANLFYHIAMAIKYGIWEKIEKQFIQQGFQFDGVMEYCMKDMQDSPPRTLLDMIGELDLKNRGIGFTQFVKRKAEKWIAVEYIKMMKDCKNWRQFYHVMKKDSDFHKKLRVNITKRVEKRIK